MAATDPPDAIPGCFPVRMVLESTDRARSAAFYHALTGWEFDEVDADGAAVTICRRGGREVARICDAAADRWSAVFATADLDATRARAAAAGGTLTARPGWGAATWQLDHPAGMRLGLEPPARPARPEPELGGLALAELSSWDVEAAVGFCRDVLGLRALPLPDDATAFHVLLAGDHPVAGLLSMEGLYPPETEAHWLPYLGIDDCDLALVTAVELGARVRVAPLETVLGRYAVIEDPLGAAVGLIRPVTESAYRDALAAQRIA